MILMGQHPKDELSKNSFLQALPPYFFLEDNQLLPWYLKDI